MKNAIDSRDLSIIIPAKNEYESIGDVVASVRRICADSEIVVVDDGSTDRTGQAAEQAGARVIRHPIPLGNGAAIKSGVRAATGDT